MLKLPVRLGHSVGVDGDRTDDLLNGWQSVTLADEPELEGSSNLLDEL